MVITRKARSYSRVGYGQGTKTLAVALTLWFLPVSAPRKPEISGCAMNPRLINLVSLREQVVVTDEDGVTWFTQQVVEADSRRRFQRIQCIREVT